MLSSIYKFISAMDAELGNLRYSFHRSPPPAYDPDHHGGGDLISNCQPSSPEMMDDSDTSKFINPTLFSNVPIRAPEAST